MNIESGACYQGQTHGHEGFLLTPDEAKGMMSDTRTGPVIHPYLIAEDLIGSIGGQPSRYVIDLNRCDDILSAKRYGAAFSHVESCVLPKMRANAESERAVTKKENGPRQSHFQRWWKFWRVRLEMLDAINSLPRYVACGQVTKRPIFEFIDSNIRPNAALIVFPLADDYSFGILQSDTHWKWFKAKCSTLTERFRYTSDTVFDTFPWPQAPTLAQVAPWPTPPCSCERCGNESWSAICGAYATCIVHLTRPEGIRSEMHMTPWTPPCVRPMA